MNKQQLKCRAHQLKFEYPSDWHKGEYDEPACPLCLRHKITILEQKLKETTKHKDTLLRAINLKLCDPVDNQDATD